MANGHSSPLNISRRLFERSSQWTLDSTRHSEWPEDIELARSRLVQENARLNNQEAKLKKALHKFNKESLSVKQLRSTLQTRAAHLQAREHQVAQQREHLQTEQAQLRHAQAQVDEQKTQLAQEYVQLRRDKLKAATHQKLLRSSRKKVEFSAKQLQKLQQQASRSLKDCEFVQT